MIASWLAFGELSFLVDTWLNMNCWACWPVGEGNSERLARFKIQKT